MLGPVISRSPAAIGYGVRRQILGGFRRSMAQRLYASFLNSRGQLHRSLTTDAYASSDKSYDSAIAPSAPNQDQKIVRYSPPKPGAATAATSLHSQVPISGSIAANVDVPEICPGCGAKSQSYDRSVPGYYDVPSAASPNTVSSKTQAYRLKRQAQDVVYQSVMAGLDKETLSGIGIEVESLAGEVQAGKGPDLNTMKLENDGKLDEQKANHPSENVNTITVEPQAKPALILQDKKTPFCARCHTLLNHRKAVEIPNTTYAAITKPILECKYSRIHIYHVIDAADFPMSILPNLSRNILRHIPDNVSKYKFDFSFIVTRADLLMPKESMITSLMTYLRAVLKEALPSDDKMGAIRVVSARHAWTTEAVKTEIRKRKGGVFLIGRTNVGKSRLFESIYPRKSSFERHADYGKSDGIELQGVSWPTEENPETPRYGEMPTVSEIPGTTVGPIKLELGRGLGELVDLPGLERGKLFHHVRPECIKDMIMTERINPEQHVIKPGQCLLLAGIIKIQSTKPDQIILVYPFLTLPAHVTSVEKAQALLNHADPASMTKPLLFGLPNSGESLSSAGVFKLAWDVTHQRNVKLRRHHKSIIERVPYRIYSMDLLVEGCGWVEIVAQVRLDEGPPEIEVFSPHGTGIGSRMPMGAEMLNHKPGKKVRPGARPRRSMKGAKKHAKMQRRAASAGI